MMVTMTLRGSESSAASERVASQSRSDWAVGSDSDGGSGWWQFTGRGRGTWGLGPGPFKFKCRAQPERAVGKKKSGPRAQPEVPRASQPARSRRAHALARGAELARRSSGTRRDPK